MIRFLTQAHSTTITPVIVVEEHAPPKGGYTIREVGADPAQLRYVSIGSTLHCTFEQARQYLVNRQLRDIAEATDQLVAAQRRLQALHATEAA